MNGECYTSGCKCRKFKGVPNQPKTTLRNVRVDDQLWGDAKIVAAQNDTNVSEVVRHGLWKFILENDHGPEHTATYRAG